LRPAGITCSWEWVIRGWGFCDPAGFMQRPLGTLARAAP